MALPLIFVKFVGIALDPLVEIVALKCPKKTLSGKEDPVDIFANSGIVYYTFCFLLDNFRLPF